MFSWLSVRAVTWCAADPATNAAVGAPGQQRPAERAAQGRGRGRNGGKGGEWRTKGSQRAHPRGVSASLGGHLEAASLDSGARGPNNLGVVGFVIAIR